MVASCSAGDQKIRNSMKKEENNLEDNPIGIENVQDQQDERDLFVSDSSEDGDDGSVADEIQKALDNMIQQQFEEMQNEMQQQLDDQINQEIQKQIDESTKSYELELERSIEEELAKDLETSLSIQILQQQHSQMQSPSSAIQPAAVPQHVNEVDFQINEIVKRYKAGEIKD